MLGKNRWRTIAKAGIASALVILLVLNPLGVQSAAAAWKDRFGRSEPAKPAAKLSSKVSETAPPNVIQELRQALEEYQPQVAILSPRPNEVLSDNTVSVRFQVKDLPIFKSDQFGLGPHLHVLLDNEPYRAVYDLSQPLVLENLEPGTHSLRVFASRPWHESFKNEGAYAQTTFHIFTKTGNNQPDPNLPLLTYSRPQASYGAEPIMLDFYLTNAPLHLVAREDAKDEIADWRIRCTVNGESFVLDNWQPVYLKGFKPGKNWVQLEFLDETGAPVPNVFNNTVRLITYEPNGNDTLSKLVRGELSAAEVRGIVDPNYKPEVPEATPSPTPTPEASIAPVPAASPRPAPTPEVTPTPEEVEPVAPTPIPSPVETPEAAADKREAEKQPETVSPQPSESVPAVVPETPKPRAPKGGFFNRFRPAPAPIKPAPSPTPEVSPSPEAIETPQATEPTPEPTPTESPEAVPTEVPQVLESPEPEQPTTQPSPEMPTGETTPKAKPQGGFFNRFRSTFNPAHTPAKPVPTPAPAPVEALPTPSESVESVEIVEPTPTETPEPEATPTAIDSPEPSQPEQPAVEPAPETPVVETVPTAKPKGGFFDRFRSTLTPSAKPAPGKVVSSPAESPTATKPAAEVSPTLPDLQPTTIPQALEAPALPEEPIEAVQPTAPSEVESESVAPESSESVAPESKEEATPAPEVTPSAQPKQTTPEERAKANKEKLNQLFDRLRTKSASPTASPVPPSLSPAANDSVRSEPADEPAESASPESAESASSEPGEPAERPASPAS